MKKVLGSVLLLTSVYATAGENYFQDAWDAKGLLAIEGAFGTAQTKQVQDNPSGGVHVLSSESKSDVAGGLKLGGESEDYRVFISARYHVVDGFDSVITAGAELQYLLRAGENFNLFLGLNGGALGSQATVGSTQYSYWDPYAGADIGANIDIHENFGLEFGARFNKGFGDQNDPAVIDYLAEGYVSLVFKFTGEY